MASSRANVIQPDTHRREMQTFPAGAFQFLAVALWVNRQWTG